jgi:hypothetical protein
MSHREWRALGIPDTAFNTGPDSSEVYYNTFAASDVVLRALISVFITAQVLEQPLFTVQPSPIICQVDNFAGAVGDPPPALRGDGHSLAVFMPTLYPGPVVGAGDIMLPTVTRLWVGGTGGQPISTAGQRDANGAIGGRHVSLRSGWAMDSGAIAEIQPSPWSIVWDVQFLVLRTP